MQTQEFRFWQKSQMENNPAWIGRARVLAGGTDRPAGTVGTARRRATHHHPAEPGSIGQARQGPRLHVHRRPSVRATTTASRRWSISSIGSTAGGTPLTRADLALAHVCSLWPEARGELRTFSGKMADRGFAVDLNFLVRCLAAAATGSVLLEGSFLKTPAPTLQNAWEKMQPAFEHLVSVLRQEAFIGGLDDLPTNFVLIPATIYLARQGGQFPSDANPAALPPLDLPRRAVGALLGFDRYQASAGRGAGVRARPGPDTRVGSGDSP